MKKLLPVFLLALCLPFAAAHAVKSPFVTLNGDEETVVGRQTPFSSWQHPNTYRHHGKAHLPQGRKGPSDELNNDETGTSNVRRNNGNFVTRPSGQQQSSEDYN